MGIKRLASICSAAFLLPRRLLALTEIAREGYRIWLEDRLVLRLEDMTTEVASGSR